MARPDRIRKIQVFALSVVIVGAEPTIQTISQENSSTTMVRIAVAASESVFLMPHFARIAVKPANSAEPNAKSTHIHVAFLSCVQEVPPP